MDSNRAKQAAGIKGADFVENGMIVGLGTGSTARYFIEALGQKFRRGLAIQCVASSHGSAELAKKENLPLVDINSINKIDLTVDGADEIDAQKRMIKGGGGALLREKILAASSREMIVIVDESKLVSALGQVKLPVEILFFGSPATRSKIESLGYKGIWRTHTDGSLFITESGNLIYDIALPAPCSHPETDHQKLKEIPGVIETGFFFRLAGRVIVGKANGTTRIWN